MVALMLKRCNWDLNGWHWGSIDGLTLKVLNVEAAHCDGGCQWARVGLFCSKKVGDRKGAGGGS